MEDTTMRNILAKLSEVFGVYLDGAVEANPDMTAMSTWLGRHMDEAQSRNPVQGENMCKDLTVIASEFIELLAAYLSGMVSREAAEEWSEIVDRIEARREMIHYSPPVPPVPGGKPIVRIVYGGLGSDTAQGD